MAYGSEAAARYSADGHLLATHFMIGHPVMGEAAARMRAAHEVREARGDVLAPGERDLGPSALNAGFAVGPTVTDGDCGLDVLCALVALERSLDQRRRVRRLLSDAMQEAAICPGWQEAFALCQERAPMQDLPPPRAYLHESEDSSDDSAAGRPGAEASGRCR